eukprot:TRINITY_DN6775_c0_g1_i1.p1 TRINITY_DN6775_c0_g1~~TRINITY_DN6775_c0_g1_i1.p1  ORF type:complete len:656 (+),score=176.99 TRINITY_DN6775_c0_g1_i1:68-2035(+)
MQDVEFAYEHTEGVYRNSCLKKEFKQGRFLTADLLSELDGCKTAYECFNHGVNVNPNNPCLGTRFKQSDGKFGPYEFKTYAEVSSDVNQFGSGLLSESCVEKGSFIGIYSRNNYEWVVVDQACNAHSLVSVPLYSTLSPEHLTFIIHQTEMSVVCGAKELIHNVIEHCINKEDNKVTLLIQFEDDIDPKMNTLASEHNVKLTSLAQMKRFGKSNPIPHTPPSADDLATCCFTSGTTGVPKGAMLTHLNIVSTLGGALLQHLEISSTDTHISYLPSAHMMERVFLLAFMHVGAKIGFYTGDVKNLMADISALAPTIFLSVPRLYNRIHQKIMNGVNEAGGLKKFLFNRALKTKLKNMRNNEQLTHWLWDRIIFKKVQKVLGGRIRFMLTGSAPLSEEVKGFMHAVFGVRVYEGYGLTETTAGSFCSPLSPIDFSSVGSPLPQLEYKVDSVPEMEYLSTDSPPRGEVCIRGNSVFKGYFKRPDLTAEVLDEDGWFHTGDIGKINSNGTLSIIDRKKNIFKLSQGEYICPEKIENIYGNSPLLAQVFIYGDSLQSTLLGIIVPDEEASKSWANNNDKSGLSFKELCLDQDFKDAVIKEMKTCARVSKLHGFEQAKDILLESEPFSVENGLLTPTFKLKRTELQKAYGKDIEQMYSKMS